MNRHRSVEKSAGPEKLEHEREELLAQRAVPATKASIQAARSQWFRVVTLILNNLELSKAPPEAIEAIRGPVLRTSERAGKRYAGGTPDTNVVEPDADAEEEKAAPDKKPVG